jgi:hypothetical protein
MVIVAIPDIRRNAGWKGFASLLCGVIEMRT